MVIGEMQDQLDTFRVQLQQLQATMQQEQGMSSNSAQMCFQLQQGMLKQMEILASHSKTLQMKEEEASTSTATRPQSVANMMFLKSGGQPVPKLTFSHSQSMSSKIATWIAYKTAISKFVSSSFAGGAIVFEAVLHEVDRIYVKWLNTVPEKRSSVSPESIDVPQDDELPELADVFLSRTIGDIVSNGPQHLVLKTVEHSSLDAFSQWVMWFFIVRRDLDVSARSGWSELCAFVAKPSVSKDNPIKSMDDSKFICKQVREFGKLFSPNVESLNPWIVADGIAHIAEQVLAMVPEQKVHSIRTQLQEAGIYGFSPDDDDMEETWSMLKEACSDLKVDDKSDKLKGSVCHDFLKGKCSRGANCKYRHPMLDADLHKSISAMVSQGGVPPPPRQAAAASTGANVIADRGRLSGNVR